MADGSGKLKGLREQMVAAAQAIADERRSQTGSSPVSIPPSVIDGSALRTDERQRLARERREERERLNAAKEKELLEKEKKSKLQYEKQMEEKQRKLEEQKLKDEQKRIAAEEKRKQRLLEDKERREANVRRTLERSSQLDQRQKRWSWGGSAEGDKLGTSGSSCPSHVDLIGKNASTAEPQAEDESGSGAANIRSSSASNLKQADNSIHKRLSSSSATLEKGTKQRSSSLSRLNNKTPSPQPFSPRVSNQEQKGGTGHKRSSSLSRLSSKKSPPAHLEGVKKEEKTAHRPPSSPLDSSLISRLLAPTQSSLARSKSAATLSADGKELPESHLCPRSASAATTSTPPSVSKGPMRSRSIDRVKTPSMAASGSTTSEASQKSGPEKPSPPSVGKRPPSPTATSQRRSPSPAGVTKRAPSPTLEKKNTSSVTQRTRPPSPSLLKQRPASPTMTPKPVPIQRPSLTPPVLSTTKKTAELETKPKEKSTDGANSEPKTPQTSEKEAASPKTKDEPSNKTISGSATAEEAAKLLAENRRLAREQREREEQERIQRQHEEKIRQEEMARKAEEERVRLEEESKLLEEKRKLEREEEERLAQELKIRRDQEEQERLAELQQQREEAEAKALEEAEKQRQEREKIMQQNMQERMQRKKRIQEIMKRTRKNDENDVKSGDKSEDDEDSGDAEKNLEERDNEDDIYEDADTPSEVREEITAQDSLSQKTEVVESKDLFINGDRLDIEEKLNGHSSETASTLKSSQVPDDIAILSQDGVHCNEDNTADSVPKLNGKSATWTFEEIIDLGIHSKTSNLSVDSIAMDTCNPDLIEAATITPKLAFEEGQLNSLSATIETAAEM
ncbi:MAP7 domain-containing protein 3 isoform X2 [Hyla sarda]|uniref:MAP7 domain-containing protein 3 isoform X2 n=1 Tax=Hyla sarda TaxID=327740 RepID=UPI0024C382EF|nr:MAP7 domain-containing protein 3 isoform X2 [Hyla sarda]